MQTFLPFADFNQSARSLDSKRLGNQCYRECKTLLTGGWKNHPASIMWRGHEIHLAFYGLALAVEMERRGNWRKGVALRWKDYFEDAIMRLPLSPAPPWLGYEPFHRAHQSNLIRKAPVFYRPLFPGVPDDLPYIWPSKLPQFQETPNAFQESA